MKIAVATHGEWKARAANSWVDSVRPKEAAAVFYSRQGHTSSGGLGAKMPDFR